MSEGTPHTVMAEVNHPQDPQRRRSPRFASPRAPAGSEAKMALGMKRSITVRKIAPRKTTTLSGSNKENTPRRPQNTKVSTPEPGQDRRTSTISSAGKGREQCRVLSPSNPSCSAGRRNRRQPAVPSPIVASSLPTDRDQDPVWTQKVRRSYSRLSDGSPHGPANRETLFGFEKLNTPEVVRSRLDHSRSTLELSGSVLEADERGPEPDPDIPGVAVVKEKRRRRKVQQIATEELEVLAAQMNAEFREAEEFELVVE